MLGYFSNTLYSFRGVFSRQSSWVIFCMVIIGFIGGSEMVGITSFCRFWGFDVTGYYTFLHFFRYSSWSLEMLMIQWTTFVLAQGLTVMVQGRAILLGDHTYAPKDGRRMPGVVTLHQDSETQSKPSYFRGHHWGAICLMIGSLLSPFGLPLVLGIHQGLSHIDKGTEANPDPDNLKTRIIRMALDFSLRHHLPCLLVLDAYFPCASVFHLAASIWSIELKAPLITLIIRAKNNCVAYYEAPKVEGKRPKGRPAQYGKKVKLTDFFDKPHWFSRQPCQVYGKIEEISVLAINLFWKPTGNLIRFVLATTSRGAIVLMCSDLNQDPLVAIRLYCARTRIEMMFDMLKNLIGAFCYRFWSKFLPRHSRNPQKNQQLQKPSPNHIDKVRLCWNAYERFTMLAAISLGILQLMALKFSAEIWKEYDGFLRTCSRELPSERTVKHVMARLLIRNFFIIAPITIMREIRRRYFRKNAHFQHTDPVECINSG